MVEVKVEVMAAEWAEAAWVAEVVEWVAAWAAAVMAVEVMAAAVAAFHQVLKYLLHI
jgi:hypothetical protein